MHSFRVARVGPSSEKQLVWLNRLSYGVMLCTGMIDAVCVWAMNAPAPSGMTGNIRTFAANLASPQWLTSYTRFYCPLFFIVGVICSGIWTNHKDKRDLEVASKCIFSVGLIILYTALIVQNGEWPDQREVMYCACWAMGLQGGIMKATTGFADTTGVSGTLTDIGLIIGQALNPENRSLKLWRKLGMLTTLVSAFVIGAFLGSCLLVGADFAHEEGPVEGSAGASAVAWSLVFPGVCYLAMGTLGYVVANFKLVATDVDNDLYAAASELIEAGPASAPSIAPKTDAASEKKAASEPAEAAAVTRTLTEKQKVLSADIQKAVDKQKDALVRTALIACYFVGAVNYIATKKIAPLGSSISHISGNVYKLGIGLGDAVTHNDHILLREHQGTHYIWAGLRSIGFWLLGAILSGIVTRHPADRSHKTGSLALAFAGSFIALYAVLVAVGMPSYYVQLLCFICAFLNGVMSSTTGFARTGHFTGVLMNIGLLIGQLTNPENNKPEMHWKLRQSCYLLISFVCGTMTQSLLCHAFISGEGKGKEPTKPWVETTLFAKPWVFVLLAGSTLLLLGLARLAIRARRIRLMLLESSEPLLEFDRVMSSKPEAGPQGASLTAGNKRVRQTVAMLDIMALQQLQKQGMAGGFTMDQSMYPTKADFKSSETPSRQVSPPQSLQAAGGEDPAIEMTSVTFDKGVIAEEESESMRSAT